MSVSMTVITLVCCGQAEKTASTFFPPPPPPSFPPAAAITVPSTVYFGHGLSVGSDFLWLILLVDVLARTLRISEVEICRHS